jgi:hypothetical protein
LISCFVARRRNNLAKLHLYTRFQWTLIACVAATVRGVALRSHQAQQQGCTACWRSAALNAECCRRGQVLFAAWSLSDRFAVNQNDEPDWENQWWQEG